VFLCSVLQQIFTQEIDPIAFRYLHGNFDSHDSKEENKQRKGKEHDEGVEDGNTEGGKRLMKRRRKNIRTKNHCSSSGIRNGDVLNPYK